jgi:hypothetical protein
MAHDHSLTVVGAQRNPTGVVVSRRRDSWQEASLIDAVKISGANIGRKAV